MRLFILFILLSSIAHADITCTGYNMTLKVAKNAKSELSVTYKGETAFADGILTDDEVDLVAKLPKAGELTLLAKIGKSLPENYVFLDGQRKTVLCRKEIY